MIGKLLNYHNIISALSSLPFWEAHRVGRQANYKAHVVGKAG